MRVVRGGPSDARLQHNARLPSPFPHARAQASDGSLVVGELSSDLLGGLATALGEVYGRHVAERTEWGKADADTRDELARELQRTAAALDDACRAHEGGLALAAPPAGVDLDDALRSTVPRGKSKRATIDAELVTQLQSACWRRRRRMGRGGRGGDCVKGRLGT